MNTSKIPGLVFGSVVLLAIAMTTTWPLAVGAQEAYDAYGYDYQARVFSGLYENADWDSTNETADPCAAQ